MILLVFSLVFAQTPEPLPPPSPENVTLGDRVATLINQAIQTRQQGELAAAERLLIELQSIVPPDLLSWYWYQRGICAELLLKPVEAESFYRQAIAEDKGTASIPAGNDAALRLAMVLEGQGRDREALEEIRKLAGLQDWSEADAATIELQRGILEVNQGFTRKGVRHIEEALSSFEGTDSQTWLRAKGRYTLALVLYSQAMKLDFDASDKKAARNLKKRAELMRSAEDQVLAVIGLNQVEWVLACLIALGDAYLDWGADLKAAKAPKGLSEAEAEIWRTEILRYASNAEKRALHAWEQGIELAIRLDFESTRTTELKTRINHLKQQQ